MGGHFRWLVGPSHSGRLPLCASTLGSLLHPEGRSLARRLRGAEPRCSLNLRWVYRRRFPSSSFFFLTDSELHLEAKLELDGTIPKLCDLVRSSLHFIPSLVNAHQPNHSQSPNRLGCLTAWLHGCTSHEMKYTLSACFSFPHLMSCAGTVAVPVGAPFPVACFATQSDPMPFRTQTEGRGKCACLSSTPALPWWGS